MDPIATEKILNSAFNQINKLKFLEENPSMACIITDSHNNILWANTAFLNFVKFSIEELLDKPFDSLRTRGSDFVEHKLKETLKTDYTASLGLTLRTKTDREFTVFATIVPLNSDNNRYFLYVFSFYSDRVKNLLNSMHESFKQLTGSPCVVFITLSSFYPYTVELITNNCFLELGQDYQLIQSKSILEFTESQDKNILIESFESLILGHSKLETLTIGWYYSAGNKKVLDLLIQLDEEDKKHFYVLAAPSTNDYAREEQALSELKEISYLPQSALSKIEIIEECLNHQRKVEEFQDRQARYLQDSLDQLRQELDDTKDHLSGIYLDVIAVIEDWKSRNKRQEKRIEKIKDFLIKILESPTNIVATVTLLTILFVEGLLFFAPEGSRLKNAQKEMTDFLEKILK
jgi:hypothetical protein